MYSTDLVRDFFSLCSQYVRYASLPLSKTNLLATVYLVSTTIIPLLQDKGVRSALAFVESKWLFGFDCSTLINHAAVVGLGALRGISAAAAPALVDQAEAIVQANGKTLLSFILQAIGGSISAPTQTAPVPAPGSSVAVSRNLLRTFSELLYEFVQNYPNQVREWGYPILSLFCLLF